MASKTVSEKSKSTTATKSTTPIKLTTTKSTTTTDDLPEESIITIKQASCKNLQGTATLTYHIGRDENGVLHWRIFSNSGNGMYSRAWVAFTDIQHTLEKWPKDLPITSITLRPLYSGSVNTPSFLLATLVNEGILQQKPDTKRHYQLGDTAQFLAAMKELTASDSKPAKATGKVKAKAVGSMSKGKTKAAAGE